MHMLIYTLQLRTGTIIKPTTNNAVFAIVRSVAHLEDGAPQRDPGPGEVPRPHGAVELANLVFRLHPALVEQCLRCCNIIHTPHTQKENGYIPGHERVDGHEDNGRMKVDSGGRVAVVVVAWTSVLREG